MTVATAPAYQPVPELAAALQLAMNVISGAHVGRPATDVAMDALMHDFLTEVRAMAERGELAAFDVHRALDLWELKVEAEHVMTSAGLRMRVWFDAAGTPLAKFMRKER